MDTVSSRTRTGIKIQKYNIIPNDNVDIYYGIYQKISEYDLIKLFLRESIENLENLENLDIEIFSND